MTVVRQAAPVSSAARMSAVDPPPDPGPEDRPLLHPDAETRTDPGTDPGAETGTEAAEGDGVAAEPVVAFPEPVGAPDEAVGDEFFAPPPVVVVMVTHDPGPAFEDALASIAAQDYPGLSVLVVDNGSEVDPSGRVAAVLPDAFVRRVTASVGFGGAANHALSAVEGASFLLLCHDDVVLDPNAIRLLVEEAYRSNAAICGPKLVDWDRPEVLVDVGRAIDRFGGAHTGIEPGELDQEQHDAVRDVFYVTSATMLVRADLFVALNGFDQDAFPGSEDLDLCWRARLAGARVLVVPDARVRHRSQSSDRPAASRPDVRELARRRVRTLFTCYSLASLLWIVPFGLALSMIEAVVFVFSRRRAEAFAEVRAWWWNTLHFGRLRRARRRAQSMRTIHDSELHELQLGWTERVRSFLNAHHADERVESMGDRLRAGIDSLATTLRHPGTVAFLAFLVVLVFGSRKIISKGVPGVGTLVRWTGVRPMLDSFGSAWHYTGLGAPKPASGALAGMAALTAATLNHPGLAQTLLVVGIFVIGPLGVARLVRRLGAQRGPAMTAALLYGVNPASRNAIANGRLGPLVLFAVAPFLVSSFIRAAGFDGISDPGHRVRATFGVGIFTAIAIAFFPPAALFLGLLVVAFFVGSILTGRDVMASLRGVLIAVAGAIVAGILLLPWSTTVADVRTDPAAFGFAFRFPDWSLTDVLRFHTGPSGAGYATWGLYAAAAFALVVASGPRLAWVARAWFLAAGGLAAVYLPSQLWPDASVPAPEGALVAAALGLAVAAGLGVGALGDELRRAHFGWRQLAALLASAGVALMAIGFTADSIDGRWHSATTGWNDSLSFAEEQTFSGQFRILWIGDPAVLPTDLFDVRDGIGYALTVNGPGDARALLRAPKQDADAVAKRAVSLALDGRTNRLGRIVAPMGVRYIAAPTRNGPGGPSGTPIPGLRARLADQLDLAQLQAPAGLDLYQNTAWFPSVGVAPDNADVPTGDVAPIPAALATDLAGSVAPVHDRPVDGQVLFAQAFDEHWRANASESTPRHRKSFGWANQFAPVVGTVDLEYTEQRATTLMVFGQGLLWLIVLIVAWRGRRPRVRLGPEPDPIPEARRLRRERAQQRREQRAEERDRIRREELDDDFWSRV
jgi:GT2 family glycosyltransferase